MAPDYGPEEEQTPVPSANRSDWPVWANGLHTQMTGLETFVREEMTEIRRLIIHGPTADDHGAEPSARPPSRRVRGRQTGSSSSITRRSRNE
ncbi:hypothetical protein L6452_02169 [Arctium lappa]|uniref:Uncharacterized protein n=1 Tax=Arctium lappa TaxID=4217 RepID=A0ACB9FJQ0_ARCLA|nr:hypothetical protein L6452_02169 [Arctium lappa]